MHLLADDPPRTAPQRLFDNASLAVAENSDGAAVYATDFQPGPSGFVRILVADRGMSAERAGALVQRVIEIETYRTLALLGLPEAQRLSPSIAACERRLAEVTEQMRRTGDLAGNHRLLDELTALAAEVEAGAAASVFRFGASRAYEEIVEQRLQTIGERKVGGLPTWSSFLARRMKPALRTCVTIEARQVESFAETGARGQSAAHPRRCRTGAAEPGTVEIDERADPAATAAADHGGGALGGGDHLLRGQPVRLPRQGRPRQRQTAIEPSIATAVFVPVAALAIWWMVRSIRRKHIAGED